MKKALHALLLTALTGSALATNTESLFNQADAQLNQEHLVFEFERKTVQIEWQSLLADSQLPPIGVNPPQCYGYAPLCNLVISMLAAGRDDIPAGCHYSGHASSDVYYCEIQ